jgi:hypothetical protein
VAKSHDLRIGTVGNLDLSRSILCNAVATDFAASQLINRRYVIEALPAAFFVN